MSPIQPWWMPAIKIFFRVWAWILVPAFLALGIIELASRFSLKNGVLVAILVVIGMFISFIGIWREAKTYL